MKSPTRLSSASFVLAVLMSGCTGNRGAAVSRSHELTQQEADSYVQRGYIVRNEASCAGYKDLQFTDEEAAEVCCIRPTASEFVAVIPRLGPGTQIVRTGGDIGPGPDPTYRWFEFSPEIVGDHLVVTKTAHCNCHWDKMECRYVEEGGVFDVDPTDHFALGPGVRREEAFEVARLYRKGRLEPADWFQPWNNRSDRRIEGVVSRAFEYRHALLLYLSSEACSFVLPVRIEGEGEGRHLHILAEVEGGCV